MASEAQVRPKIECGSDTILTRSQVRAMRDNISDGTFTAEHYHTMWTSRLAGAGKQSGSSEPSAEPYRVGRLLGEGAFGVVFAATTPEGKRAVMKSPIAASHNFEVIHEGNSGHVNPNSCQFNPNSCHSKAPF